MDITFCIGPFLDFIEEIFVLRQAARKEDVLENVISVVGQRSNSKENARGMRVFTVT